MKIELENGSIISLNGKSLLILPADSKRNEIINKEGDYDVIIIIGGLDKTVIIELQQPATIVIDGGIKTIVNVKGGMALPISKAVFIGGIENKILGITKQSQGKIKTDSEFAIFMGAIAAFSKIEICK